MLNVKDLAYKRSGDSELELVFCFSGIERKDEIYSASQLLSSSVKLETIETPIGSPEIIEIPEVVAQVIPAPLVVCAPEIVNLVPRRETVTAKLLAPTVNPAQSRPQTATSKLFAPRTEEMNKGFLMFSDEEPGLTSKYLIIDLLFNT